MTDSATLPARSLLHASNRPDHPALIFQDRTVSYRQLHRSSNRTAHALIAAGLAPGARVAYLGKESADYWDLVLGCAKAGLVIVPVNWRLTAAEVEHILRDSGAALVFVERSLLPALLKAGMDRSGARVVELDDDPRQPSPLTAFTDGFCEDDLACESTTDTPVVQMYTSGTSGLPKGVVLAHRTFFTFIDAMRSAGVDWIDWRPDDRSLICFPGLHSAGMAWFMHIFNVGGTNLFMRRFDAEEAVRIIEEHRVTTVWAAPSMLHLMLNEPAATPQALASLRKIIYGGSPISLGIDVRCMRDVGLRARPDVRRGRDRQRGHLPHAAGPCAG